jgi:hypothetical protein
MAAETFCFYIVQCIASPGAPGFLVGHVGTSIDVEGTLIVKQREPYPAHHTATAIALIGLELELLKSLAFKSYGFGFGVWCHFISSKVPSMICFKAHIAAIIISFAITLFAL